MEKLGFVGDPNSAGLLSQIFLGETCELVVWNPSESEAKQQAALEALSGVSLLVFSAPLGQARGLARRLGDFLTGRHVVLHTIRGVEPETLRPVSQLLQEETPTQRIGFLTGPARASELSQGMVGSAVCASFFPEVHDLTEEVMHSSTFRLYRSQDLVGAEFSAAYGRVMALMGGLSARLELGESLKATLFARGLAEMAQFVVFRQGFERTTFGLSGAGNLYLDTQGEGSVDYRMGKALARGEVKGRKGLIEEFGEPAQELVAMMEAFQKAGSRASLSLYLLEAASQMIVEERTGQEVLAQLMGLPAFYE